MAYQIGQTATRRNGTKIIYSTEGWIPLSSVDIAAPTSGQFAVQRTGQDVMFDPSITPEERQQIIGGQTQTAPTQIEPTQTQQPRPIPSSTPAQELPSVSSAMGQEISTEASEAWKKLTEGSKGQKILGILQGISIPGAAAGAGTGQAVQTWLAEKGLDPSSPTVAALAALTDAGTQMVMPMAGLGKTTKTATRMLSSTRPIKVFETAEKLQKYLPEGHKTIRAFYDAASKSGKAVIITTPKGVQEMPFEKAQRELQNLQKAASARNILPADRHALEEASSRLTGEIEKSFPGFAETQKDYHRIKSVERLQDMLDRSKNPAETFRKEVSAKMEKGQIVFGPKTLTARAFDPKELREINDIMTKLGPKPGSSLWEKYHVGRIIGTGAAGLAGMHAGGWELGMAAGAGAMVGPQLMNHIISWGMLKPRGRQILTTLIKNRGLVDKELSLQNRNLLLGLARVAGQAKLEHEIRHAVNSLASESNQ